MRIFISAKALVTPFRTMVVPPPMCAYSVELPNTPVLMAPSYSDPNSFLTLQQDGNIKVFNIVDGMLNYLNYLLVFQVRSIDLAVLGTRETSYPLMLKLGLIARNELPAPIAIN